jgi:hypothetical protein
MGGGDVDVNECAVGGDLLGVSGTQTHKQLCIWVEKWPRTGSQPARETAEFRPSPRRALLLEVINDRGDAWNVATPCDRAANKMCGVVAKLVQSVAVYMI